MSPKSTWSENEKLVFEKLAGHDKKLDELVSAVKDNTKETFGMNANIAGIKVALENIQLDKSAIKDNTTAISELKTCVAQLEVKSSVWGAIGGVIGFVTMVAGIWIQSGLDSVIASVKK